MNARIRSLQRDPAVLAAVARYGVILDWPLTSAAPSASALPAAKAAVPWQCGDQPELRDRSYEPESVRLPDSQP